METTDNRPRYLIETEQNLSERFVLFRGHLVRFLLHTFVAILFGVWDMSFVSSEMGLWISLVCTGFASYYFLATIGAYQDWLKIKGLHAEMVEHDGRELVGDEETSASSDE